MSYLKDRLVRSHYRDAW